MELYELRPKTLELVMLLREAGTIGPNNHVRDNGKTTALLIHTKELLDQSHEVVVASNNPMYMRHEWTKLFPQSVYSPRFTNRPPFGRKIRLMVDEPQGLKWTDKEWLEVSTSTVLTVGPWL